MTGIRDIYTAGSNTLTRSTNDFQISLLVSRAHYIKDNEVRFERYVEFSFLFNRLTIYKIPYICASFSRLLPVVMSYGQAQAKTKTRELCG